MSRAGKFQKAQPEAVEDTVEGEVQQSEPVSEVVAETVQSTEPEAVEYGFVVAQGRSVTCLKGILGAGAEVTKEHLSGGQETLDALIKRGVVIAK